MNHQEYIERRDTMKVYDKIKRSRVVKKYIVIDVGCHECGVESELVGVYDDKKTADKVAEKTNPERWRDGGQSIPEVFEVGL